MATRSITRQISLPASPEAVFELLITPSAIRRWWQASRAIVMPLRNGVWAAAWGDEEDVPDYMTSATLEVFEPPKRLVLADYRYYAKSGPMPFEANFKTDFRIEEHEKGSRLIVKQDGFPSDPGADEYFHGCKKGWEETLRGVLSYVTSQRNQSLAE